MEFNPKSATDWSGVFSGFLSGSMTAISFLLLVETEIIQIFVLILVFMVVGLLMLLDTLLRFGRHIQFFTIMVSFAIGCVVSISLFLLKFGYAYLLAVILLSLFHYIKLRK